MPQAAAPQAGVPERYSSQAFALWNELRPSRPARILLLGGLRASVLRYLAPRATDLGVVDLDPRDVPASLAAFGPQPAYDAAIAWDLPSHCSAEGLAELGGWLGVRLRPGAPVFVSLATRAPLPAAPGRYEIVDARQLEYLAPALTGEGPVHSSAVLARAWPAFTVVRSFLLRSGMQEYLLQRME